MIKPLADYPLPLEYIYVYIYISYMTKAANPNINHMAYPLPVGWFHVRFSHSTELNMFLGGEYTLYMIIVSTNTIYIYSMIVYALFSWSEYSFVFEIPIYLLSSAAVFGCIWHLITWCKCVSHTHTPVHINQPHVICSWENLIHESCHKGCPIAAARCIRRQVRREVFAYIALFCV